MGRFNIWDQRYDGLEINEKIRQIERDNLLYEQTEALKAQADMSKRMAEAKEKAETKYISDLERERIWAEERTEAVERRKEREKHEKIYINSLWTNYNNLKGEIDNLNSRLKTYLYGTNSYTELYNLIKEKESELERIKYETETKVSKFYEDKVAQELKEEILRKNTEADGNIRLSREAELSHAASSCAMWLFDIIFIGIVIALPISYFIDIQNGMKTLPITIGVIIGLVIFDILIFMIKRHNIIKTYYKSRLI